MTAHHARGTAAADGVPRPPRADDDGAAALLTVGISLAVLVLGLSALLPLTHVLAVSAGAQTAADAAALAAMGGSALAGGQGEPDIERATAVARANGARVLEIDVAGWPRSIVVTVSRPLSGTWPLDGREVRVSAAARVVAP